MIGVSCYIERMLAYTYQAARREPAQEVSPEKSWSSATHRSDTTKIKNTNRRTHMRNMNVQTHSHLHNYSNVSTCVSGGEKQSWLLSKA